MTKGEFNWMCKMVEKADSNSDVWWMGFLWCHLTKLQSKKMSELLATKGCIKQVIKSKGNEIQTWYEFPSGIQFRKL